VDRSRRYFRSFALYQHGNNSGFVRAWLQPKNDDDEYFGWGAGLARGDLQFRVGFDWKLVDRLWVWPAPERQSRKRQPSRVYLVCVRWNWVDGFQLLSLRCRLRQYHPET